MALYPPVIKPSWRFIAGKSPSRHGWFIAVITKFSELLKWLKCPISSEFQVRTASHNPPLWHDICLRQERQKPSWSYSILFPSPQPTFIQKDWGLDPRGLVTQGWWTKSLSWKNANKKRASFVDLLKVGHRMRRVPRPSPDLRNDLYKARHSNAPNRRQSWKPGNDERNIIEPTSWKKRTSLHSWVVTANYGTCFPTPSSKVAIWSGKLCAFQLALPMVAQIWTSCSPSRLHIFGICTIKYSALFYVPTSYPISHRKLRKTQSHLSDKRVCHVKLFVS